MKAPAILLLGVLPVLIMGISPASAEPVGAPSAQLTAPIRLRCDYRVDPWGIDSITPRLDWIDSAREPFARAVAQSGYQILVA